MNESTYIDIQKYKYYKIFAIPCKYLSGELVFFNNHGLNHILRKNHRDRLFRDQYRRFELIKYCKDVLYSLDVEVEYRVSHKPNSTAYFWGITGFVDGKKIKVVIRRIENGQLIFLSVMDFN